MLVVWETERDSCLLSETPQYLYRIVTCLCNVCDHRPLSYMHHCLSQVWPCIVTGSGKREKGSVSWWTSCNYEYMCMCIKWYNDMIRWKLPGYNISHTLYQPRIYKIYKNYFMRYKKSLHCLNLCWETCFSVFFLFFHILVYFFFSWFLLIFVGFCVLLICFWWFCVLLIFWWFSMYIFDMLTC